MEQKKINTIFSALLIIIFLTACSSPAPTVPQTTETQAPLAASTKIATQLPVASESSFTPAAANSLCTNAYYPVREGATWSYKSTGGPAGEYSFTDTIASVREDGFTLSTQIGDLTRTQEWTCTSEGLTALQLGGAPAAMLNSQNIQLNLDAKNSNGVTFPRQMNPGDQWQQSVDVDGSVVVANEQGTGSGNAQMKFQAIGIESVAVPAGTFDAMKIQADTTLNITVAYEGLSLPVKFSGTYTYWFAQGVGWVKASGTGSMMGTSFSETTELQSYNIP
jgi:hypothetical protein